MSAEKCPDPQPDCKYSPNCFSDDDHIIPRRLGDTALKKCYLSLPQFRQQICRRLHEERHARHDSGDTSDIPEFPSEHEMRLAVLEAVQKGILHLSKNMEKKIGL